MTDTMNDALTIVWKKEPTKYDYWYGATHTRFSVQIGQSTNAGKYVWMIFHQDFCGAVWLQEADTPEQAQAEAQRWLSANAKPQVESPKSVIPDGPAGAY